MSPAQLLADLARLSKTHALYDVAFMPTRHLTRLSCSLYFMRPRVTTAWLQCGSCYAHAPAACIEALAVMEHAYTNLTSLLGAGGARALLGPEQVVQCKPGGCAGGWVGDTYIQAMRGLLYQEEWAKAVALTTGATVADGVEITAWTSTRLRRALCCPTSPVLKSSPTLGGKCRCPNMQAL